MAKPQEQHGERIQPLENVIRMWEAHLFHDKWLMSPATVTVVEATVRYLKQLKAIDAK